MLPSLLEESELSPRDNLRSLLKNCSFAEYNTTSVGPEPGQSIQHLRKVGDRFSKLSLFKASNCFGLKGEEQPRRFWKRLRLFAASRPNAPPSLPRISIGWIATPLLCVKEPLEPPLSTIHYANFGKCALFHFWMSFLGEHLHFVVF